MRQNQIRTYEQEIFPGYSLRSFCWAAPLMLAIPDGAMSN